MIELCATPGPDTLLGYPAGLSAVWIIFALAAIELLSLEFFALITFSSPL